MLRTLYAVRSVKADIIPVDVVVNTMIAATFYTAKLHNKLDFIDGWIGTKNIELANTNYDDDKQTIENQTVRQFSLPAKKEEEDALKRREEISTAFTDFNLADLNSISSSGNMTKLTNSTTTTTTTTNKIDGITKRRANGVTKQTGLSTNNTFSNNGDEEKDDNVKSPPIVHCTSGDINPITWGNFELMFPVIRKYPSAQVLRYPFGTFKSNRYVDGLTKIFAHLIPALIIDLICGILGKKRQLLSVYSKLDGATSALTHFCTHNYNFRAKNIKQLEATLSELDRKELFLDITSLNWWNYFDDYVLGAR